MISPNIFALSLKSSISAGGNWNIATTWSPSGVPGCGDSVVITNGTVTLNTNATVGALTLTGYLDFDNSINRTLTISTAMGGSGNVNISGVNGILTIGGAPGQVLYVQGNFSCSNAITWPPPNTTEPKIVFNGTGIKTFYNSANQGNFEVNSSLLTVVVTSALQQGGNMIVTAGTLDVGSYIVDYNSMYTYMLSVANGATLKIGGARPLPQYFTTYMFGATSTVEFNGINQTIANKLYGNLILSGSGTKTMPGAAMTLAGNFTTSGTVTATAAQALTVNGNFTIGLGTTFCGSTYSHSVKGNFSKSGTFNANTSTFTFNGSSAQTITGATTFNNFTLNNTKPVNALTLNSCITVNGIFSFTDGHLITTSSNILTLGAVGSVSLNGSPQDSSFVKGPMIQTVATTSGVTKCFPVGKGTIVHQVYLTVTHSSATSTQYTCEYINSSAMALGYTFPPTLDKVSDVGYWTINKGPGASVTTAMVKLYYYAYDVVTDAPHLRIAKDNGAAAWVDLGGAGTIIPSGSIASTNNFTYFCKFSLANLVGGSNPLPVELLFFNAQLHESIVDISWATASELNSDSFMLERASDGLNFVTIAQAGAAGYSNQLQNYSSIDNSPLPGLSYYRLKQIDYDGTETYSKVVSVYNGLSENHPIVYNNPLIGSTILVRLPDESANDMQVIIHSINGQEMFSKKVSSTPDGMLRIAVDPYKKLSSGVYLLTLISSNRSYQEKLIVQ